MKEKEEKEKDFKPLSISIVEVLSPEVVEELKRISKEIAEK